MPTALDADRADPAEHSVTIAVRFASARLNMARINAALPGASRVSGMHRR
jgi:hypothetical protein